MNPMTRAYYLHLTRMQMQIEKAKGSGLTEKECFEKVLKELNEKGKTNETKNTEKSAGQTNVASERKENSHSLSAND